QRPGAADGERQKGETECKLRSERRSGAEQEQREQQQEDLVAAGPAMPEAMDAEQLGEDRGSENDVDLPREYLGRKHQQRSAEQQRPCPLHATMESGAEDRLADDDRGRQLDGPFQSVSTERAVVENHADALAAFLLAIDGNQTAGAGGGLPMDAPSVLPRPVVAERMHLEPEADAVLGLFTGP